MEADKVVSFMAACGCDDPGKARQYLEMSDFDVNQAVSLFFEVDASNGGPSGECTLSNEDSGFDAHYFENKKDLPTRKRGGCRRGANDSSRSSHMSQSESDGIPQPLPSFTDTLLDAHDLASHRLNFSHTSQSHLPSRSQGRLRP